MESLYIASRYSRRDEMRAVRSRLKQHGGYTVTSRWLDESEPLDAKMGEQTSAWYANTQHIDIEDIYRADAVLFFSEDPLVGTPRGGRHVEFGYALGKLKPIYVIGPRENVFHYNTLVQHFDTLEEFLATPPTRRLEKRRLSTPACSSISRLHSQRLRACPRLVTTSTTQVRPLHWDKSKSTDHADCLVRHQLEAGHYDSDGQLHSAKVAWRALAQLEIELSGPIQTMTATVDKVMQWDLSPHAADHKGHPCTVQGCDCYVYESGKKCTCPHE